MIEEKFGNPLIWQRKDDKRVCRIKYETTTNGFDREQWDNIAEFMVELMILFNKALKDYLDGVKKLLSKEIIQVDFMMYFYYSVKILVNIVKNEGKTGN